MKKAAFTMAFAAAALLAAMNFVSCPAEEKEEEGGYEKLVSIPAMTITGSGASGAFVEGRTVTLSAYRIAKYETTYELWYAVKTWALSNGYTIPASAGGEGYPCTPGAAPTGAAKKAPVTYVSWRNAVVWCNAYSEKSEKTPVYYSDEECTAVIKSLSADTVYVKAGASGYRLPTEAEWEAAARGGNPEDAAAWTYTYAGSGSVGEAAWYKDNADGKAHPVGGKAVNSARLYDMSGNVEEWCFDWNGAISAGEAVNPQGAALGSERIARGGDWSQNALYCPVYYRRGRSAGSAYGWSGFRVVCAP